MHIKEEISAPNAATRSEQDFPVQNRSYKRRAESTHFAAWQIQVDQPYFRDCVFVLMTLKDIRRNAPHPRNTFQQL